MYILCLNKGKKHEAHIEKILQYTSCKFLTEDRNVEVFCNIHSAEVRLFFLWRTLCSIASIPGSFKLWPPNVVIANQQIWTDVWGKNGVGSVLLFGWWSGPLLRTEINADQDMDELSHSCFFFITRQRVVISHIPKSAPKHPSIYTT